MRSPEEVGFCRCATIVNCETSRFIILLLLFSIQHILSVIILKYLWILVLRDLPILSRQRKRLQYRIFFWMYCPDMYKWEISYMSKSFFIFSFVSFKVISHFLLCSLYTKHLSSHLVFHISTCICFFLISLLLPSPSSFALFCNYFLTKILHIAVIFFM